VTRLRAVTAPLTVARRRLRSDPFFAAALFVAIAATAFLFALVPQAFERMSERSLERAVAGANPLERDIAISGAGRIDAEAGENPLEGVSSIGATYEGRFPESVRSVVDEGLATVETVRYTTVTAPGQSAPAGTIRFLTLRHLDDAVSHFEVTQGALPSDRAGAVELPFGDGSTVTGVEIAVSETMARQLSLGLGDRIFAFPTPDDTLVRGVPRSEQRHLALEVVGILSPAGTDPGWLRDSRLGSAVIRDTETARLVYGYALFSAQAYNEVLAGVDPIPLRYEWRYLVDPAAVGRSDAKRLAADVRRIDAIFGRTNFAQRLGFGIRTGLGRILQRYEKDRLAAEAVLAVGGIALLAVALTVLGVLAALAAERRADEIARIRSRGGSLTQTLAAQALEGFLVAIPAGALGYAAATLAAGRSPGLLPGVFVLVIVLAGGALLAGVAAVPARRALVAKSREGSSVPSLSPLRLAAEALVVVASFAGAYLLRRRGLSAEGGFDPFLAAVPVLVGLAAGLLALRLYPLLLHALARAAAPRPDLVPALGLRRLARQPSLGAAPFLVVLLATAVGVFAASIASTITAAQDGVAAARLTSLDTDTVDVFWAGIAVAGLYAALGLALAPVLNARPRLRDFGYLRAVGLSRRDVLRLAAFELVPPVAAALLIGLLLGIALTYLVEPGLDLGALAAGQDAAVRPALVGPLLLAAALVLVTIGATLLAGAAARRVSLSRVLRMGER
jgi:putative ABC transport system permease protein